MQDEDQPCQIIMNYNPERKRRLEKLKARWIIVVNNDMRKTGIRNWRIEAKDRDTWWKILENPRHTYSWSGGSTEHAQVFYNMHKRNTFISIIPRKSTFLEQEPNVTLTNKSS